MARQNQTAPTDAAGYAVADPAVTERFARIELEGRKYNARPHPRVLLEVDSVGRSPVSFPEHERGYKRDHVAPYIDAPADEDFRERIASGQALEDMLAGRERPPFTVRGEVYLDRLEPFLKAKVRTPEQAQKHALALDNVRSLFEEWREERANRKAIASKSGADRNTWIWQSFNLRPQHFYRLVGLKGLPSILEARIVHPATCERMEARAWLAMPEPERRAWCLPRPVESEDPAERTSKLLADTIATVLGRDAR